jgi:hypothetical protein
MSHEMIAVLIFSSMKIMRFPQIALWLPNAYFGG